MIEYLNTIENNLIGITPLNLIEFGNEILMGLLLVLTSIEFKYNLH